MAELIKAGRYKGRPIDWALAKVNSGNYVVNVCFEVQVPGNDGLAPRCFWSGFFTDKTMENTLKQLVYCGIKGDDFAQLASGAKGGYLDINAEVELTIIHQTNPNDGKTYSRVDWVNPVGGANFRNALNEQEAAVMCEGLNLRGQFANVLQKYNLQTRQETARPAGKQPEAPPMLDDIPF